MNAYLVYQTQQMERAKTFAEIRRIEERVSTMAQAKPDRIVPPPVTGQRWADLEQPGWPGRQAPPWSWRLPPTMTSRCSSTQETSGLGRRARKVAVAARSSCGV